MDVVILVSVVVIVAVILLFVWYFSDYQTIRRALRNTPSSTIQDTRAGQVAKLVGRVQRSESTLESPFSGRKCVFYEATVEEDQASGKNRRWVTIIREIRSVDFLIDDGTGRALVRTDAMKVAPLKDTERRSGTFNDAPADLEAFLSRHGHTSTGLIFNKRLRYKEGIFEIGENIAVLGTVRWENDPDPESPGKGYRDTPKRAIVEPLRAGFVLASDRTDTQ